MSGIGVQDESADIGKNEITAVKWRTSEGMEMRNGFIPVCFRILRQFLFAKK